MSTITCQKTVSCFETQLTETTTTLKLKVAAAPPPPPPANLDFCNWGFLQTAPNDYKESCCYTHPLSKKSSFSLELCTENLGSETGTDIITDGSSIFLSPSSATEMIHYPIVSDKSGGESDDDWCRQTTAVVRKASCRETRNFPPPLSTMSGSSSMQVRRRRSDGGRLIIEAVEAPFRNSYLQAERSDGRLRLCFLTAGPDHKAEETTTTTTATSAAAGEEEQEEEKRDGYGGETAAAAAVVSKNEVVESSKKKEEFEMEMEKYQRRSRCKESGHGNNNGFCSNWKPALWVATS